MLSAITEQQAVLDRARWLADEGETQLSLHVVDLFGLGHGDEPVVVAARELTGELGMTRASEVTPYVSKSCYRSSARLLATGTASWQRLT